MPDEKKQSRDHRGKVATDGIGDTAAGRIEADARANRGLGLAFDPGRGKSRTEEVMERAANRNDR